MASFVQICSPDWVQQSGGVASIGLSGVTPGNAIVVGVAQHSQGNRTYTVSDGVNSYELVISNTASNRRSSVYVAFGVAAGTTSISVTQSGGALVQFYAQAIEVSDVAALDVADTFDDGSSVTTHNASTSGVSTAANIFGYVVSTLGGNPGTTTESSGWTETTSQHDQHYSMYQASASALTAEFGTWTSGSAQRGTNVIAVFKPVGGGGGGVPKANRLGLMGCG